MSTLKEFGCYETVFYGSIAILLGFILDLLFGDPLGRFHPVCLIGRLISALEKAMYRKEDTNRQKAVKGMCLACIVVSVSGGITCFLIRGMLQLYFPAGILLAAVVCDTTLAARDLQKESMLVYAALKKAPDKGAADTGREEARSAKLEQARHAVSRIVGRDTQALDEAGVIRAAVETVAENTTDGVVAPMCWLILGGPTAAMMYKAINTMDSMLGYKNEKYLFFGRFAARLDDVVNHIPARLAALLWCAAAALTGADAKGAFRIWRRDRRKHESPNSAQTESACAGALGVRLAGEAWYFGKKKEKPFIGDALREVECEDIVRANRMMYVTAWLALASGMLLRFGVLYLLGRRGV